MNVVVVGAGILGASISLNLCRCRCKVAILDGANQPASGATGKSWAWLNAYRKYPQAYRDLNLRSMQRWKETHADLASFCGLIFLNEPLEPEPEYPAHSVELQELFRMETKLATDSPINHARVYPQEGWCDPAHVTRTWLDHAQQMGAQLLLGHTVQRVLTDSSGAVTGVETTEGVSFPAEAVVLAAGTGVAALAAGLGVHVPLLDKPSVVVLTPPLAPLLSHMIIGGNVFMLQRKDGRMLLGELRPPPGLEGDTADSSVQRILAQGATWLPALHEVAPDQCQAGVGMRPWPRDGHPLLGFTAPGSGVYVAVSHSGVTLAPLLGELVAQEVAGERRATELNPFRIGREVGERDRAHVPPHSNAQSGDG